MRWRWRRLRLIAVRHDGVVIDGVAGRRCLPWHDIHAIGRGDGSAKIWLGRRTLVLGAAEADLHRLEDFWRAMRGGDRLTPERLEALSGVPLDGSARCHFYAGQRDGAPIWNLVSCVADGLQVVAWPGRTWLCAWDDVWGYRLEAEGGWILLGREPWQLGRMVTPDLARMLRRHGRPPQPYGAAARLQISQAIVAAAQLNGFGALLPGAPPTPDEVPDGAVSLVDASAADAGQGLSRAEV